MCTVVFHWDPPHLRILGAARGVVCYRFHLQVSFVKNRHGLDHFFCSCTLRKHLGLYCVTVVWAQLTPQNIGIGPVVTWNLERNNWLFTPVS